MSTTNESRDRPEPTMESDLYDQLLDSQAEHWATGHRIPVEYFLQQTEDDLERPVILDLIYNEIMIRQDLGESPCLEEYTLRFPELSNSLTRMFEVHQFVATVAVDESMSVTDSTSGLATNVQASTFSPPGKLAGYELLEPVGRGGMGVVHRAKQNGTNRQVAIKLLHVGSVDSSRFSVEAQAMARLRHPSIVPVHEAGTSDGVQFLVMDFVGGESLANYLDRGPIDPREAAVLMKKVALAVEYAHSRNVIHRDLKPQNILLDPSGEPQIVDFGLARFGDQNCNCTTSGEILGTLPYMSPEQARGTPQAIGRATDVYGIGTVLYHLLTGNPPHQGSSVPKLIESVLHHDPQNPISVGRGIPIDLSTICMKCLQKEVPDRYRSAADVAEDLQRFLEGRPVSARPLPAAIRIWRIVRRRPRVSALLGGTVAMAVMMLLGSTWAAWKFRSDRQAINQMLVRTEDAEADTRTALLESKLLQARMTHQSRREGQQNQTLKIIDSAKSLAAVADRQTTTAKRTSTVKRLRDELAASLSVPDVTRENWEPFVAHHSTEMDKGLDQFETTQIDGHRISVHKHRRMIRIDKRKSGVEYPKTTILHSEKTLLGPVAIDPAGKWLAAATFDKLTPSADQTPIKGFHLSIWNLQEPQKDPLVRDAGQAEPIEVMFSQNENAFVIAGGFDFFVVYLDSDSTDKVSAGGEIKGCRIDPSGQQVAVWDDCYLRLVDLSGKTPVQSTQSHATYEILSADWHPDGTLLAIGSADHYAYMFYASELDQPAMTFYGALGWINSVSFSNDGILMTSCESEARTRLYDIGTGECVLSFEGVGREFDPTGTSIEGSHFGVPTRWRLQKPNIHWTLAEHRNTNIASHGDVNSKGQFVLCGWTEINLWDLGTRRRLRSQPSLSPYFAKFLSDDQIVVLDQTGVCLFAVKKTGTKTELIAREVNIATKNVHSICAVRGQSGPLLGVIGQATADLYRIDPSGFELASSLSIGSNKNARFSPDGKLVGVVPSNDNVIRIYDVEAGTVRHRISTDSHDPRFEFSDASDRVVVGDNAAYQIIEMETFKTTARFAFDEPPTTQGEICFCPDDRYIAISHRRDVIDLVDVKTGEKLVGLPVRQNGTWLRFTRDGSTLLSRDAIYRLRGWDLRLLRQQLRGRELDWE